MIKMIDIGTKVKSSFLPFLLELDKKEEVFRKDCLDCMRLTSEDLQKKQSLNFFFGNCCFIQLHKKNDKNTIESITCIAQDITKALSQVPANVFLKSTSPEEVCDAFKSEWRLYQTEEIKEEHYCCTTAVLSTRKQA